jgi:hypothetical protein
MFPLRRFPVKIKGPTQRGGLGTLGVPPARRQKARNPQIMHVTRIAKESSIKESCLTCAEQWGSGNCCRCCLPVSSSRSICFLRALPGGQEGFP